MAIPGAAVKTTLHLSHGTTYVDYLAAEQMSERRHEFIDGVIVVVPSDTFEHSAIGGSLVGAIGSRVRRGCFGLSCNQRFWIETTLRARYCDVSVVCGPSAHPPHDGEATTNPSLAVEVLPPSTAGDDSGDKRRDFQTLPALQAYVVVAQDVRRVQVYRRDDRGSWRGDPDIYRDGDSFVLPMLTQPITVDEVYDGILDVTGRSLLR